MSDKLPPIDEDIHAQGPFTCIDRVLPDDFNLSVRSAEVAVEENTTNHRPNTRQAIEQAKKWEPGRTLRIFYMDGDPVIIDKVNQVYPEWTQHANIKFEVSNDPRSEIRISFREAGSWSYIGTDALLVPSNKPTMNYGWLRRDTDDIEYRRVVLHEFGHALGLIHEHQNPATDIPWDKEAVYSYYSGSPNFWDRAQTDRNLFWTYDKSKTQFIDFDRDSIMLYPVEQRFTVGDFEIGWNNELSKADKEFIAQQYPGQKRAENEIVIDGDPIEGEIGEFGEVDLYTFVVDGADQFVVETHGRTDVSLSLFGPDDPTDLVAEDDDSGRRLNAKVEAILRSGTYSVQVRHFSKNRTGEYSISVKKKG